MARERREVWEKRVERWREGGLTAEEFARELGCKASTLRQWKYKLAVGKPGKPIGPSERIEFVELVAPAQSAGANAEPLEVVVGKATIRVPKGFDAETLGRLVAVLEGR